MRVCFWSSTFQADNHALADHLARAGHDVTVAMPDVARFQREPVLSLRPFTGRMLERDDAATKKLLAQERFDVVVVDNHLPSALPAPRMLVLWHGFGWRIDDLNTMRKQLKKLLGDVTVPNPNFRWQAFGDWDREYRVRHSELAEENVVVLGSAYSDWLRPEGELRKSFAPQSVANAYSIDVTGKVVLLGLTWHHGGSLGHWGDEQALLERLFSHVAARGASTLVRMHDKHRYQSDYVKLMESLARRFPGRVMLKWKNEAPDSLVDMLVSDVCISNYSSLLNAFYYSERPSIHIDPHDASAAKQVSFKMFLGRPMRRKVDAADELWKLPPEENGGLRAQSFEQLLSQVDVALADEHACQAQTRNFLSRYISNVDGQTCARIERFLQEFVRGEK